MADMFNALMQGRQMGQQDRLGRLASQAYTAPQENRTNLLGQMAEIDPRAAQAQQGQFQQDEDRTGQQLRGYVEYVNKARESNNPMAVNAALRAGAPLIQRITGKAAPTEWTPDMDAGWAELEAKVAMTPGSSMGRVQSTYVDDQGQRVAIMADGSQKVLGGNDAGATQQTISITGPDGRPAQYTFDRRTGNYVPAGAGMAAAAPQPAAAPQGLTQFTGPDGMPVKIGDDIPDHVRQQILANPSAFQEAPDGAQARMPDRQVAQFSGGGSPFVGQSPAEKAASEAAARAQVELSYAPALQQVQTQGAIDREVGLNQIKSAAETVQAAPGAINTMQQSLDSIDALLTNPNLGSIVGLGSINPINRIPGTEARGLIARADQIAGQSFLAAFNQLKGGGAITEREGAAATAAMARLDRSQGEADYKAALSDLKSAIEPAMRRQRESLSRAQRTVGGPASQAATGSPARVQSADDYNRLPAGAMYIAPDGTQRRKR